MKQKGSIAQLPQVFFLLLAILAPALTLGLAFLPKVFFEPNMFLSALPLANEIATIHLFQLLCVELMACVGISLTRGMRGWVVTLSQTAFWICAIATCLQDPIFAVGAATVFRHLQGLAYSPQAIMDAVGLLPSDAMLKLAHPVGWLAQGMWCVGIGLAAAAWFRSDSGSLAALSLVLGMLFVCNSLVACYIGCLVFAVLSVVWELKRLGTAGRSLEPE
ncbi:MAG: hypothetical protein AB4040_04975 [Synechococcus sp.]